MGLGSGIRDSEKIYYGSRIQGSKRHRIRIRNTAKLAKKKFERKPEGWNWAWRDRQWTASPTRSPTHRSWTSTGAPRPPPAAPATSPSIRAPSAQPLRAPPRPSGWADRGGAPSNTRGRIRRAAPRRPGCGRGRRGWCRLCTGGCSPLKRINFLLFNAKTEMECLDISLKEDSSLLLHAIHSPFYSPAWDAILRHQFNRRRVFCSMLFTVPFYWRILKKLIPVLSSLVLNIL